MLELLVRENFSPWLVRLSLSETDRPEVPIVELATPLTLGIVRKKLEAKA